MYKLIKSQQGIPLHIEYNGSVVLSLNQGSLINDFYAQDVVNCLNRTLSCRGALENKIRDYQNIRLSLAAGMPVSSFHIGEGC